MGPQFLILFLSIFAVRSKDLPRFSSAYPNVLITFSPNPIPLIQSFAKSHPLNSQTLESTSSRGKRIQTLVSQLQQHANNAQKPALELLAEKKFPFQQIWVTNQLFLKNADVKLLQELQAILPNAIIEEDRLLPLEPLIDFDLYDADTDASFQRQTPGRPDNRIEWGIAKVKAEDAVYLLNSSNLPINPVKVGIIDTGVRPSHEILIHAYPAEGTEERDYAWFDPYQMYDGPVDFNGHGTHVSGTILGSKGVGVYPDAKLMACRGCIDTGCSLAALAMCGQFIICPTLANMSAPDCSMAPQIVSNSWGSPPNDGDNWFVPVIEAWTAVGIIPVFSGGNDGPACSSAGSPGNRQGVIAVGSTMENDTISYFSGRGPTYLDGMMKPDVVAPGHFVLSSWILSDISYATASGTSMAAPHVAGIVAMLKALNPALTFAEIKTLLQEGVDTRTLTGEGQTCGGLVETIFPNHIFGSGRVNALKIVNQLLLSNPPQQGSTSDPGDSSTESGAISIQINFVAIILMTLFVVNN